MTDTSRRHAIKVLGIGSLTALGTGTALARRHDQRTFTAHLEAAENVETDATGEAVFQINRDGTGLHFGLTVANIENVTMAHIHSSEHGGAVVAWLYPDGPPPVLIDGRSDGVLNHGTLMAGDLVGPLEGAPLSALLDLLRGGNAFVNVHTEAYPGGEIRGQIN